MREVKYWSWHMLAGVIILILLGLHMITVHLYALLGWFNPAGGAATDWPNLIARGKLIIYTIVYIIMLASALYHGFYGFRTILFELGPTPRIQKLINTLVVVIGLCLFIIGTWAVLKFQILAQAV